MNKEEGNYIPGPINVEEISMSLPKETAQKRKNKRCRNEP